MADYRENWTVDDWKVELDEAIYQIHEYISIDNRMSKEYYPGIFLMPREMHTIEAVVIHPGINATSLASVMGFSKGMLSKLIRELERRGMVTAYKKKNNLKEVHYRATPLGRRIYESHVQFHKMPGNGVEVYEHFYALPNEQKLAIIDFLYQYGDMYKSFAEREREGTLFPCVPVEE